MRLLSLDERMMTLIAYEHYTYQSTYKPSKIQLVLKYLIFELHEVFFKKTWFSCLVLLSKKLNLLLHFVTLFWDSVTGLWLKGEKCVKILSDMNAGVRFFYTSLSPFSLSITLSRTHTNSLSFHTHTIQTRTHACTHAYIYLSDTKSLCLELPCNRINCLGTWCIYCRDRPNTSSRKFEKLRLPWTVVLYQLFARRIPKVLQCSLRPLKYSNEQLTKPKTYKSGR